MNADPGLWLLFAALAVLVHPIRGEELLDVQVLGLHGELLDNVRASLSLQRQGNSLQPASLRELHEQAPREIARALEPFGYYRPGIKAELHEPAGPGAPWLAIYQVDAGPPLTITELDIRIEGPGMGDPQLSELVATLPLQRGEPLDHRRYEEAKRTLLEGAREQGYLEASLGRHRIEVDLSSYSSRIELWVSSGPRYVIGPIEFEQNQFHPEYLSRYLVLQAGDPYRASQLSQQRQVLVNSGHFQEVEIQTLPTVEGDEPAIPLRIPLEPYPPNRFRGRLGWGTDTGVGVQLDWTRRYLGGRGHRFNAGVAVVQERKRLAGDLSYLIPLEPLTGSQIELTARHESKDLTYRDVDLEEGGETRIATNLLSPLWHLPHSTRASFAFGQVLGLTFVTESYDIFEVLFGNLPSDAQDIIIGNIGDEAYATLSPEFEALVPNISLTLRRSDDRLFINDGDFLQLILLGANENLESNISFWQARLNTWHIRPLFEHNRLLLRTALGYSDAESRTVLGVNFNQMPEYYEFRAGGARSVRGYGYETLFPADAITGGKNLLVGSIEYEQAIIPDWSAAIFLDAGNAFNNFDDIDLKLGTGFGVRWRSPVGMARVDLGFPLDDADDDFQIYITVGPEF